MLASKFAKATVSKIRYVPFSARTALYALLAPL
jgi:hypothetical protein